MSLTCALSVVMMSKNTGAGMTKPATVRIRARGTQCAHVVRCRRILNLTTSAGSGTEHTNLRSDSLHSAHGRTRERRQGPLVRAARAACGHLPVQGRTVTQMTDERFLAIEMAAANVFGLPLSSYERNITARLYDELAATIRHEVESELLEYVESAVIQGCYNDSDGYLDSMAISTWAEGIRLLAAHGRAKIVEEHGRRVIAQLTPEGEDGTDD